MTIRSPFRLRATVAAAALAAALSVSACDRANQATVDQTATGSASLPDLPATLPLTTGDATPVSYAPPATALPDVAPIRTVRVADDGAQYAYADQAYGFADALGDAPPDYGFDYRDADPWAWQGYDDSLVFAEPIDDGYRQYFYRPGADQPYFIRDPDYGYGYDDGQLAVVYDSFGGVVPWADYGPRVTYASRYLVRGRDLYRASRQRRRPVIAANWVQRGPVILQGRRAWQQSVQRQPAWENYRRVNAQRERGYWQQEAVRREADARRYANWQRSDFRAAPPPRAIPANWQRANWARDDRRYAPVRIDRREQVAQQRDRQQQIAVRQQQAQALAARQQQIADRRINVAGNAPDGDRRDAMLRQRALQDQRRQQLEQRERRVEQRQVAAGRGNPRQQAERQQAERQQAARQQADRTQAQRQATAQRAQRQQQQANQREQARSAQREQAQAAQRQQQAAQREQAQAAQRQQQAAQREQARSAQREQAQAAQRQQQAAQREQARSAQREQAQAAQRQQQAAQREQARSAQREQAQAAQRQQQAAQREQARSAQREQAQAAQRQQQAAQREQARSAQREQAQAAQRDQARAAQQAARQQAQAARQQQPRPERGGPGGGGRDRPER